MFKTIPLHIAPGPEDRAAIERKRSDLDFAIEQRRRDERAADEWTAGPMTLRALDETRHLGQVVAGPVPIYRGRA